MKKEEEVRHGMVILNRRTDRNTADVSLLSTCTILLFLFLATTHLGGKGTSTTIHQQNKGRRPRIIWIGTLGVSLGDIDKTVAHVLVGIVDVLCNGSTVGRHTKHGFLVGISFRLVKRMRNLLVFVEGGLHGTATRIW